MPRPKAFDPNTVLDRAVDLFWARGFEAVSVQDLVDHLGISRSSLLPVVVDNAVKFPIVLKNGALSRIDHL